MDFLLNCATRERGSIRGNLQATLRQNTITEPNDPSYHAGLSKFLNEEGRVEGANEFHFQRIRGLLRVASSKAREDLVPSAEETIARGVFPDSSAAYSFVCRFISTLQLCIHTYFMPSFDRHLFTWLDEEEVKDLRKQIFAVRGLQLMVEKAKTLQSHPTSAATRVVSLRYFHSKLRQQAKVAEYLFEELVSQSSILSLQAPVDRVNRSFIGPAYIQEGVAAQLDQGSRNVAEWLIGQREDSKAPLELSQDQYDVLKELGHQATKIGNSPFVVEALLGTEIGAGERMKDYTEKMLLVLALIHLCSAYDLKLAPASSKLRCFAADPTDVFSATPMSFEAANQIMKERHAEAQAAAASQINTSLGKRSAKVYQMDHARGYPRSQYWFSSVS